MVYKLKEYNFNNKDVYLYLGILDIDHEEQNYIHYDFVKLDIYINDELVHSADVPGYFTIFSSDNKDEFCLEATQDSLKLLRFCNFKGKIIYSLENVDDIILPRIYIKPEERFDVEIIDEKDWMDMGGKIILEDD